MKQSTINVTVKRMEKSIEPLQNRINKEMNLLSALDSRLDKKLEEFKKTIYEKKQAARDATEKKILDIQEKINELNVIIEQFKSSVSTDVKSGKEEDSCYQSTELIEEHQESDCDNDDLFDNEEGMN